MKSYISLLYYLTQSTSINYVTLTIFFISLHFLFIPLHRMMLFQRILELLSQAKEKTDLIVNNNLFREGREYLATS